MAEDEHDEDALGGALDSLEAVPEGSLSRGLKLGRALLGAAGRSAGRRLFWGERGAARADAAAGEGLALALGDLKGLAMKLGQMLSYVDLQTPAGWQPALSRLQQRSRPMAPQVVVRTLEEDLGQPPEALFAEWDAEPVAAASIGQVHRARLKDGTEVAVKVRYPGIERAVEGDLKNIALLRHLTAVMAPGLDGRALVEELRERFLDECDYRKEAAHQTAFASFFRGTPGIRVPEVVAPFSSARVLTTTFIHGRPFREVTNAGSQEERDAAARALHYFAFASIFRMGSLNCDPHPGNYLFSDDSVAFLDFGCVRHFSSNLLGSWRRMLRSALERDFDAFSVAVRDIGLVGEHDGFDFEAHYSQYLYLIRPWLTTEPAGLTPAFVAMTYRALVSDNPNRHKLAMPAELLFANRLQWGLFSLLARLRPRVSLREEILAIVYAEGEERPTPFSDSELRRHLPRLGG